MRLVRSRAAEFNLNPDRIGAIGYSAGGHLVSMLATHFDAGNPRSADPVERVSSRPDFVMLIYPVITFSADPYVNVGVRGNFLGDHPDPALFTETSSELHVQKDSPPAFLVCGGMDKAVDPENSILYYQACRKAGVPAEIHIYQQGEHGLGDPHLQTWHDWAIQWMGRNGWIPPS